MKSLSCADLGTPECHFVATGETAEEATQKMMDHAMDAHKDKVAAMNMSPEEVKAMMMSKVKDA